MATLESSPFLLSWVPEIEDYAEALRARNLARDPPAKRAAMLAVVLLLVLVGFLARQPPLLAAGLGGLLSGVVFLSGQRLRVWSFWRGSRVPHTPTQARLIPGRGVISSVPGFEGPLTWSSFGTFLETERVFVLRLASQRRGLFSIPANRRPFLLLAKRGLDSGGDVSLCVSF